MKALAAYFFARVARKVLCLHEHLTSTATVSELVSETSPKGGDAYDLDPMIMLKDQRLKEAGFDIGDYISGTCENGKLIIAQDAERVAVKVAEAEYMEREMKALQNATRPRKSKQGLRW